MKNLFFVVAVLCISVNVYAIPPSRGPAVERGDTSPEKIVMPVMNIEVPYHVKSGANTKTGCGGDCRDGVHVNPGTVPSTKPVLDKIVEEKQKADKELVDAAREWYLEDGEKPLEDPSSIVIEWLIDKMKDKLLGPIGEVIDAMKPTDIGLEDFDKIKNKEQLKRLRAKLELEEKELKKQKEANEKAYEENTKLLFPIIPDETTINREPASTKQIQVENAIKAIAKLRSEDLFVIADHVIRRSKIDAPIRLPIETANDIAKVLRGMTASNACAVSSKSSCVLFGVPQGKKCYCPEFKFDGSFITVTGIAIRKPVGRYCRTEHVSEDLHGMYPIGVSCRIPVDLTIDPRFPQFSFIMGRISKEKCESWIDKTFKSECND